MRVGPLFSVGLLWATGAASEGSVAVGSGVLDGVGDDVGVGDGVGVDDGVLVGVIAGVWVTAAAMAGSGVGVMRIWVTRSGPQANSSNMLTNSR